MSLLKYEDAIDDFLYYLKLNSNVVEDVGNENFCSDLPSAIFGLET